MTSPSSIQSRRMFLGAVGAVGASLFAARGSFAEALQRTPSLTEGPFYPDKLPLDTDNDLIIVGDDLTPAVGEITHLTGRVLDATGAPIKGAIVEIWQCDAHAVYLHTRDSGTRKDQQDKHFQGYGRFTAAANGGYRFRTIKPVPYPGRPAGHIHFKVKKGERELLTSQIFIAGSPNNARDGVFRGIRGEADRKLVCADFKPVKDSKTRDFAASFDIVVGRTPDERSFDPHHTHEPHSA